MISNDTNQDLIEEKIIENLIEEPVKNSLEKAKDESLEEWLESKSIIELSFELFNLKLKKKSLNSKSKKEFKPHLIRLLKKRIAFLKKKSDSGSMRLKKFNRYRKNYL